MKIGFEVFLAVARELSISQAAKQLHITPQCASDHIRRLEKEYQVTLFERKPHFHLTTAGEIMLRSLQNMQIVESSMEKTLGSVAQGNMGAFTLGISTSRAPIILPRVLPRYYREFPNVNISFIEEDTQVLEERLLSGQIDLFIGVNTTPYPEFRITTMTTEEIMLVTSSGLLHQYFTRNEIQAMREGIDLNQVSHIPFTLSVKTGKVNYAIQEYLNDHNVHLSGAYNISDSETQIMLCTSGICAALCPRMLLVTAYRHNLSCGRDSYLYMFPVKNLGRELKIDLVSHKNAIHPPFLRHFMKITQEEVRAIAQFDLLGARAEEL